MAWDEQKDERTEKLSWRLTRRHFIRNAGISLILEIPCY